MTEAGYQKPNLDLLGEEHTRRYRETDGEIGYLWNGATTLLLTTTGKRTGLQRTIPIIFAPDGADYVIVASMGGAPRHPSWYHNLRADPNAEVQVQGRHIPVLARIADGQERERLWAVARAQWPNYDVYQSRTERVIPVVALTPRGAAGH